MTLATDLQTILDESGAGTFWPLAQLYDAGNEAQLEVFASVKPQLASAELALAEGDGVVTLPTTLLIPQYILMDGKKYLPTTTGRLERYSTSWLNAPAATPEAFILWDWEHLRVWPTTAAATTLTIWGVPYPTEFADPAFVVAGGRALQLAVAYRAAATLLEHVNPPQADQLLQEAESHERKARIQLRNTNPHRVWRVKPGTTFRRAGNIA
jgi:hypothetical protein